MSITIGFIGGGNMSTAIAKGILRNDSYSASQIWVSGPHTAHLKHWEEMGANVTDKNGEVLSKCDVVFLGVKPGVLSYAVSDCLKSLPSGGPRKNFFFVSMLAGIAIETLHEAFKVFDFPTSVIRIMPNTPMSVGAGICLYTPDDTIKPEQCMLLEKLLNSCGICEKVTETLMNSGSCLPGCGPAFMYIVIEALADGAVKQGVPRAMALRWASQVLVGSGEMVLQSKKHPGHLKDEVCSPGGSTICGVTALENGRIRATLISAIEAATLRTYEMGKK
ncbi:Pyrroline-5-carboxylate reductase 1, mitochondrial [Papilio machaon]|uniref:Pyrroline-5-carboxylate reductase n=1 Tax=Papilio machaon TaxID=76193 RepID=A0A194RQ37_PAPMA|nr:Pyrroline-5-carboxylate reductase 1, mitochondrial [Papilio machaon]